MELSQARTLAEALASSMKPYVRKGLIAGSIRRCKPDVKDIELVLIPSWGTEIVDDLFGDRQEPVNLLKRDWADAAITREGLGGCPRVQWIKPSVPGIVPWQVNADGKYWRGYLPDHQVKLDIFVATPETWGTIAMMRTGAAEFSAAMFAAAKRAGYTNFNGELHDRGRQVAVRTEQDAFRLLGVAWVEPPDRTGADAVKTQRGR